MLEELIEGVVLVCHDQVRARTSQMKQGLNKLHSDEGLAGAWRSLNNCQPEIKFKLFIVGC